MGFAFLDAARRPWAGHDDSNLGRAAIMIPAPTSPNTRSTLRWRIALLVSAAIVLSHLDRQTLPWTLSQIHADYPFSDQIKALFDSAFLIAYGLMYLGGGWLLDRLGTRRGFLLVMIFWIARVRQPGLRGQLRIRPDFRNIVCADHARGEPVSAGHGRGRWIPGGDARRGGMVSGQRALDRDGHHQRRHGRWPV